MPNAPRTQHRSVRIADADWGDLALRAPDGDRAAVIKDLIAWYLRRPGAKLPDRPALIKPAPPAPAEEEH